MSAILGAARRAYLFSGGVVDGGDEMADLVAHGLCCDAGGGGLEIDVAGSTYSGIERVSPVHETRGHAV